MKGTVVSVPVINQGQKPLLQPERAAQHGKRGVLTQWFMGVEPEAVVHAERSGNDVFRHNGHHVGIIAKVQLAATRAWITRLHTLEAELEQMVDQCACGTISDCRVIAVLRNHAHSAQDRHAGTTAWHLSTFAIYAMAALAESAGCFAVWAWWRLGAFPFWLVPALLSLTAFSWLPTLAPSDFAGRAPAA